MGQALYRKYRPRSLTDLAGQQHIAKTLSQAIKTNRISHAYLFTGPKGVGKTSVARILAHEINNIPYTDDSNVVDIIEIDAASNRRIDEIRELREKVYMAPLISKYKVYIIDEVHMLTKEAFNALLKTLEEPPEHVIFILATTDAYKLPETIISRTQRYNFKPISNENIVSYLKYIAKKEQISVSNEALEIFAEHGQGSLRDSVSLLDQARNYSLKVDASSAEQLIGLPPKVELDKLFSCLAKESNSKDLVESINKLYDQGFQASSIAKQIAKMIRLDILNDSKLIPRNKALEILENLINVPISINPDKYLEIVLLKYQILSPQQVKSSAKILSTQRKALETTPNTATVNNTNIFNEKDWVSVLNELKKKYNTLYGIAKMAKPEFTKEGTIKLGFAFDFHKKRLNETANRQILSGVIKQVNGHDVAIEYYIDKSIKSNTDLAESPENNINELETINSVFSGAELLES